MHALNGAALVIERDKEDRPIGGQPHGARAFRGNGNGSENPFERKGSAERDHVHAAGIVDRLGERLHDEELFNGSFRHVLHVSAEVNIGQNERSGRLAVRGEFRGRRFFRSRRNGPRLEELIARLFFLLRERVDDLLDAVSVYKEQIGVSRRHKEAAAERPRVEIVV